MSETASGASSNCRYCGMLHPGPMCPYVRAIEYHPDGSVKRVEFAEPHRHIFGAFPGNPGSPGTAYYSKCTICGYAPSIEDVRRKMVQPDVLIGGSV